MKISNETLAVLDNFTEINPSFTFRPGNVIRVGAPTLDIFAQAVVKDEFPSKIKIYNMKKFLGVVSLFKGDVDVDFVDDKKIILKGGKNTIQYTLSAADDGRKAMESPDKEPDVPPHACSFRLTNDDLNAAIKAMSVLSLPNMTFVADANGVTILGTDEDNPSKDSYRLDLGPPAWEPGAGTNTVRISINRRSVSFLPRDYVVFVNETVVKFTSEDGITYWVPALMDE